jgi:hypothetical protein
MFKLNKKSRFNYWSCSKFANWIRGEDKPFALEWDKWSKWHDNTKKKNPIRYWITETLLNKLQDIVNFPLDVYHTVEVYVRNRWVDKIHYLHTGLTPGQYYDLDWRILNGLFNELVIYVEGELAQMTNYKSDKKYKFIKGLCKEAGLDYLNWADQLILNEDYGFQKDDPEYGKPTNQALDSKKIRELYHWWTVSRPNRYDPYELFSEETHGKQYYELIGELENRYEEEDTNMLIELVKIRGSLWT